MCDQTPPVIFKIAPGEETGQERSNFDGIFDRGVVDLQLNEMSTDMPLSRFNAMIIIRDMPRIKDKSEMN